MNSKEPRIVKVFEASSCHITGEDDKLLKREDAYISSYEVRGGGVLYGFLIYTGLDDTTSDNKVEGFSDAFNNLLKLAKDNGCKFLQLDCDGVEYEDLPKFDW